MPTLENLRLRGLTANDRSQSDKQAIAQQNGSNLMVTPINLNMSPNRRYFQGLSDANAIMQNTYQDMLQQYSFQILYQYYEKEILEYALQHKVHSE